MYDIIIIGAGPAGISASLYAKRANMNVLIIYKGTSNVEKSSKIDNYYGFPNGITGKKLYENGIEQAKNLGVIIKNNEVTAIEYSTNGFNVKTPDEEYLGKAVIISTGNKKTSPDIKGIKEFEGKGVSYCAICDGFFYKGKNVAVIGNGEFAYSEAKMLKGIVNEIIILTNGEKSNILNGKKTILKQDEAKATGDIELSKTKNEINNNGQTQFKIVDKKIKEINGNVKVEKIVFEDLSEIKVDGIFVALGEAGATDFAKTLGIITENGNIKVNDNMETNVKGIYACGNITGGLLQVNKSVYEGAKAGLAAVNYVKTLDSKEN